jgi:hypothetical protein
VPCSLSHLAFLLHPIFTPHPIDNCCSYDSQSNTVFNTNRSRYYDPVWKNYPEYDPIWGYWVQLDDENQYLAFSSLDTFEPGVRNPDNDTQTGQWTKLDNTTYLIHMADLTDETITYNSSIDLLNTSNETYRLFGPRRDDEKRYIRL